MELSHETQREGQRCKALQAVLKGGDVVPDLTQVVRAAVDGGAGLGRKQLPQSRLRALDAAGEHGLPADEGPDQEMRVGESPSFTGEPADGAVGGGQPEGERLIPREGRRGWSRHEGAVVAGAVHEASVGLSLSVGHRAAPR